MSIRTPGNALHGKKGQARFRICPSCNRRIRIYQYDYQWFFDRHSINADDKPRSHYCLNTGPL